jgi:uncharacterized protein
MLEVALMPFSGAQRLCWDRSTVARFLRESAVQASPERRVLRTAISRAFMVSLSLYSQAIGRARGGRDTDGAEMPYVANSGKQITSVLIKPVGDICNLRCTYCYEGLEGQRFDNRRMSEATLELIIRDVLAQAPKTVQFLWHGGEPLMAGLPFFKKGMSFERLHNRRGCRIANTVQTNGLLINQDWIDFFREHCFNVGISIDGPEDIHDRSRIDSKGAGTFQRVVMAAKILQKNGFDLGAIAVIGGEAAARAADVFRTFQDLEITAYDIHPRCNIGSHVGEQSIAPADFACFVIELFEQWLESGDPDIRIGTFQDVFEGLIGQSPSTCCSAGGCSNILGFQANGNAVPCTRPFDLSKYTFGNIHKNTVAEIAEGPKFQAFREKDLAAQGRSQHCKWQQICHNGCPQHRQTDGRQDIGGANLYCQCQSGISGGYAAIFEHMVSRINEICGIELAVPTEVNA